MNEQAPGAAPRYAAFISYSHADEAHAAWLHRALEGYRIPKGVAPPAGLPARGGRIAPVFRDREELSSSSDLSASIVEALAASSALIVICSPAAARSHWVGEEIKTFKRLKGEARVFALIVEGEPSASFPPPLLARLGPDGEVLDGDAEPLAADARPEKDGRKLAFLKIAAGLLDVGLDALRQRELQRARRAMMTVSAVSLASVAVLAGLTAAAVMARNEAERMRMRAETEASTATRTAEFMIELFEVADPGESRGREVTAKEILDRGVRNIETGLSDEPVVQSNLMFTMGRVYTGLGLYDDAAGLLEKSVATKKAAGADPLEIFAAETAEASALYERGAFDDAAAIYRRLAGEIAALERENGWRPVFALALDGLGDIESRNGEYAKAEARYREAVDRSRMAGLQDTAEYARSSLGLGLSLVDQGEFAEADKVLDATLQLVSKLRGENHFQIGNIESAIGNSFYFAGDIDEAQAHFERSLAINRLHLDALHPELAVAINNLGRIKYEAGEIEAAKALLTEAVAIQRQSARDRHVDFAFLLYTLGEIEMEEGRADDALTHFNQALGLVKDNTHRLYGPLLIDVARAECENGDAAAGFVSVLRARNMLSDHYEAGDWRYGLADEYEALCRAENGEREDARRLAAAALATLRAARGPEHYFTKRARAQLDALS